MARCDLTWIPRLLGAATAACGAVITARPDLVVGAVAPAAGDARAESGRRALAVLLGTRDLASGLAMLLVPAGAPLRTAIAMRVGADVADVAVLGSRLPGQDAREKVTMAAAGRGALCALAVLAADRATR
ncbi:hypothetical protein H7X46_27115 [Pseudonocardia sp. C8]|uniref:hypothetical protein n=1 Tax=Pseudonocardia sp. C8 TaxID=2762759 RepID=UPI001642CF66|nr:hypothetical protein [Pseudonocardia sp. C8]MBC3194726.1 hypothetical protein [Pseudonocardia sp. C8]